MARRYPNRRRRRGRPPARRRRPRGFTGPGWRQLFNLILPLEGRAKRAYFNRVCDALAVGAGVSGAGVGYHVLDVPGAVAGFVAAFIAVGAFLERGRFYR